MINQNEITPSTPSPQPADTPDLQAILAREKEILLEFKAKEIWEPDDLNWSLDIPLSDWEGVTTTPEGRVEGLEVKPDFESSCCNFFFDLRGLKKLRRLSIINFVTEDDFNETLFCLENLEELTIAYNKGPELYLFRQCFFPCIPSWHLPRLRKLRLINCNIADFLPEALWDLPNLEVLDLSSNHLVGKIPPDIGNLKQLRELNLSGNQLEGELPPSLFDLPCLESLDLSSNALSGAIPVEAGKLKRLKVFRVAKNHFTGTIPPALCDISSLERLDLSSNKLVGTLPGNVGRLKRLRRMDLSGNCLSGLHPALFDLPSLESLDISSNPLSGSLPVEISKLGNLKRLRASGCRFTGDIPLCLFDLPLRSLDLSSNTFSGVLPAGISKMSGLRYLDLSLDTLLGAFPGEVNKLQELRVLRLSGNHFSGELPDLDLPSLRVLDLSSNAFSGFIPAGLGKSKNLKKLCLARNRLSGILPSFLFGLASLEMLDLSSNAFSGNCFEESRTWENLKPLDLSDNRFSGFLPVNRICFSTLIDLNLGYNFFSGPIPPWVYECRAINLCHNQFFGDIPWESLLTNGSDDVKTKVDLSHNYLTGTLPAIPFFVRLYIYRNPGTWNFTGNNLSGRIPRTCLRRKFDKSHLLEIYDSDFVETILFNEEYEEWDEDFLYARGDEDGWNIIYPDNEDYAKCSTYESVYAIYKQCFYPQRLPLFLGFENTPVQLEIPFVFPGEEK